MKTKRLLAGAAVVLAVLALKALTSAPAAPPAGPSAAVPSSPTALPLPAHAAAVVADARTGELLYAERPHRPLPIASTTKLMTALLALERVPLEQTIAVPAYGGAADESLMGLTAGEQVAAGDLLRGLLVASGNDAAEALAVGVAGSREAFVALMNRRAEELGMSETRYADPSGLGSETVSSAADLVTLTRELRRHPFFRATVAAPSVTTASGAASRALINTNRLLGGPLRVDGVKTGHTAAAGWVLVGSATRGDAAVISVVLGTRSEQARDAATLTLLRHGLRRAR